MPLSSIRKNNGYGIDSLLSLSVNSSKTFSFILFLIGFFSPAFGQNTNLNLLQASDGAAQDWFGMSIAMTDEYMVVGTPGDVGGSIYVYTLDNNGNWGNEQKLVTPDNGGNDFFGYSVSISGNTIVAGAHINNAGFVNSGAAYVFTVDGSGQWAFAQKLTAFDASPNYYFGSSVFVSDNYMAIQSAGDLINNNSGAVYMFEQDINGVWNYVQKLSHDNPSTEAWFGSALSISGDHVVIGNALDSDLSYNAGAVFTFQRDVNGVWGNMKKITAPDWEEGNYFGQAVSIDGNTFAVGAPYSGDSGPYTGSVYIYELGANGLWDFDQKLEANNLQQHSAFGFSVDLLEGNLLVGAFSNDQAALNAGAAYMFSLDNDLNWTQVELYHAFDAGEDQRFGHDVAIASNGLAIAAHYHNGNGYNAGAVYSQVIDTDCIFSLSCPESLIIEVTSNNCTAEIDFDEAILLPEIIDGCGDITISQLSGPSSLELVEVGVYEIVFAANATSGINAGCSFEIEVVDSTPPIAICQDLTLSLDACNEIVILPEDLDGGSSDACGIASWTLNQTLFDETTTGYNQVELTVIDNYGNASTCLSIVEVEPFITIDESRLITPEQILQTYGDPLELNPIMESPDGWYYTWYINGELYCDGCNSIAIEPKENILIELFLEDESGCQTYSDNVFVQVQLEYSVYIPTAFSPNHDGTNDTFKVFLSDGIEKEYSMRIKDRWGNVVYDRFGTQLAWDGGFNGKALDIGVYTYELSFKLINGEELLEVGNVCLLR